MKIRKQIHNVCIEFLVSENSKTDETKAYIALAKWLAESMLPYSAYRHQFLSSETDESIHRIEIDNITYEIITSYLDLDKFCKNAIEGGTEK